MDPQEQSLNPSPSDGTGHPVASQGAATVTPPVPHPIPISTLPNGSNKRAKPIKPPPTPTLPYWCTGAGCNSAAALQQIACRCGDDLACWQNELQKLKGTLAQPIACETPTPTPPGTAWESWRGIHLSTGDQEIRCFAAPPGPIITDDWRPGDLIGSFASEGECIRMTGGLGTVARGQ